MNHNSFILSPITDIMKDVITASVGINDGIETYPLCDYVMQSVFLKMTGAQEQKMKCISWELATNDYEYRYSRFTQKPLGECSNYSDKKEIYKDLIQQIEKLGIIKFDEDIINRSDILQKTTQLVQDTFIDSNLVIWAKKSFNEYLEIWSGISTDYFTHDKSNLFKNGNNISFESTKGLIEIYNNHLYKHRNRVAHNTLSYQQNLPTLGTLINDDYKYNNYFIYFSILILIDNIMISLYNKYLLSLEDI